MQCKGTQKNINDISSYKYKFSQQFHVPDDHVTSVFTPFSHTLSSSSLSCRLAKAIICFTALQLKLIPFSSNPSLPSCLFFAPYKAVPFSASLSISWFSLKDAEELISWVYPCKVQSRAQLDESCKQMQCDPTYTAKECRTIAQYVTKISIISDI